MTTILVTGAGRGIGYEMAKQASFLGWNVFGSVRNEKAAFNLRADLPNVTPIVFDVTNHCAIEQAAKTFSEIFDAHNGLDVLVNNAGIIGPKEQSTGSMDYDGFRETLEINVFGPLKVSQAFKDHMRKSDNPRLVTISSQMGGMDSFKSDRIAYRASKSAVNKIIQAQATDYLDDGICCISVHPGWVQTDMGGAYADITPEESAAGILEVIRNLTIQDTGKFMNWDGSLRNW